MTSLDKRPDIQAIKSGTEFERWSWLKNDLTEYCRLHNLGTGGQKLELAARISHYLNTGEILKPKRKKLTLPSIGVRRDNQSLFSTLEVAISRLQASASYSLLRSGFSSLHRSTFNTIAV